MAKRTLDEIERQIRALQAEAEEVRTAEGIEQLLLVIRRYKVGLPHFRIALAASKQISGALSPIYRNPNNSAETWTGHGRRPRWLVAALEAGYTLDQCRAENSSSDDLARANRL